MIIQICSVLASVKWCRVGVQMKELTIGEDMFEQSHQHICLFSLNARNQNKHETLSNRRQTKEL